MRTLIGNSDLKTLYSGVAAACAAGLLMGAAMQPNLRGPKDAEGPQMLTPPGGARAAYAAYEAGVAAYGANVPEYVLGTDWTRPRAWAPQVVAYRDEEPRRDKVMTYEAADDAADHTAPAQWTEPPREPPRYPSERGNTSYGADLPPPPEPPDNTDEEPGPA
jgi:hypothetical protein